MSDNDPIIGKCPTCCAGILLSMHRTAEGYVFGFQRDESDKVSTLHQEIMAYLRWAAEGQKKYGSGGQYYYDPYHSHVEYCPETDDYKFSIQTYDSPEGDTWWRGRCSLWGGCQILKITDEEYSDL